MLHFYKSYLLFFLWVFSWVVLGSVSPVIVYAYIPITLFILRQREDYFAMLAGLILMLVFSDSRQPIMEFAKTAKIIYFTLFSLFVMVDYKKIEDNIKLYKHFIPFLIVALFCLLSSPVIASAAQKTISYGLLFFVVPVTIQFFYLEEKHKILKPLMFVFFTVFAAGIALRFVMPEFVSLDGRFTGILGNPNGLGIFSTLSFVLFSVIQALYPSMFTLFEKIAIYGVIILSIFLCGSRNALFSVMLFFLFSKISKASPFLSVTIFLAIIISYSYVLNNLLEVVIALGLQDFLRIETIETGSGRTIAWEFAWENIQDSFYLGKGFGYTEFLYKKNYQYLSVLGHQGNAHNSYLTFWLDTGLIGLFLFLIGFIKAFIRAVKVHPVALAALFTILFTSNFESWLTASLNPVTIIVLIVLSILIIYPFYSEEEEEEDSSMADATEDNEEEEHPFNSSNNIAKYV